MNVPASNITLKRNILILITFISIFMEAHDASSLRPQSRNGRSGLDSRTGRPESRTGRPESRNGFKLVRPLSLKNIGPSRIFSPSPLFRTKTPVIQLNSPQQIPLNSPQPPSPPPTPSPSPPSPSTPSVQPPVSQPPESIDVQTKLLLVFVSFFTLIFVVILLIIGHFTWFADIRKELEEEWHDELVKEDERRVAKTILSEMTNPFENLEDDEDFGAKCGGVEIRRRDSIDSNGCTRGLCIPPHHSILCPINPNILQLNELFPSEDPIDFRNNPRPSTEWMNLESCVRISEPVPMRNRMLSYSATFLSSLSSPKRPMTPQTPDPTVLERDLEVGLFSESFNLKSPMSLDFDISKLDLI